MYISDWQTHKKHLLKNKCLQKALEENRVEYELARTLIKIRIDRGLTQSALAKKVNTKQSVISRMENIQSVPSLTFLKRVANALDSTLEIKLIPR